MSNASDEVPADLVGREYDLTSRHLLVARLVRRLCEPGERVLDIGGSAGLTSRFLSGYEVITTDILPQSVDVVASGDHLPFRSDSFAVAVVLDVLEHVPSAVRADLLDEAVRTSLSVVVAGPFSNPEIHAAEAHQREIFEALHGQSHPWLEEHLQCGLPSLEETIQCLENQGLRTRLFGSNPLGLWEAQLANTHIALRLGLDEATYEVRSQLLDDFLERADATPPSYRRILVATRDLDPEDIVSGVIPGVDLAVTEAAIRKTEINTGRVIDEGLRHIDMYRTQIEDGWRASVEEARALERALDRAKAEWEKTIDAYRTLERQHTADMERLGTGLSIATSEIGRLEAELASAKEAWASTAERYVASEMSRRAADTALIATPTTWLLDTSLPGAAQPPSPPQGPDHYDAWMATDSDLPKAIPPQGPKISVLVPVFNPRAEFLEACLRSVRRQTYENWELVLLNASDEPHVRPICNRFQAVDTRIRVIEGANEGIAANTNICAAEASGDFLALLDHDDELAPHALAAVAAAVGERPEAKVLYSDEDSIDVEGRRSDPFFKPAWSPDLLRHVNYITHLMVVQRDLWSELGGMRSTSDGAQDYDLALRATHAAGGALHIPDVLYHWRRHPESTASDVMVKPYAHFAGRAALEDFIMEAAPGARVEFGTGPTSHRVRYATRDTRISVIIPFKDAADLTEQCLVSIAQTKGDTNLEVLLVDNRSIESRTKERSVTWEARWPWVHSATFDEPFNFQKLNNWAVEQTDGATLLFLNNDTQAVHAEWLQAMLEHAQRPEVGAVGARLFFPNGTIQHAGVVVGIGGFAEHPWSGSDPSQWTAAGPSYWTRNFLAVTAACLMVERAKFEEVGGFDERFTIGGGDVDLGLRLHELGYWNVYTPFARLIHHESVSRGSEVPQADLTESERAYAVYTDGNDPFYNPNLSLEGTDVAIEATNLAAVRRLRMATRVSHHTTGSTR